MNCSTQIRKLCEEKKKKNIEQFQKKIIFVVSNNKMIPLYRETDIHITGFIWGKNRKNNLFNAPI